MGQIIQRITEVMEKKDVKLTDIADYLGLNKSTVSTWKLRGKDPAASYIVPLCKYLNVSVEYILTGEEKESSIAFPKGKGNSLRDDELALLSVYNALPDTLKAEFRGQMKGAITALDLKTKHESVN